MKNHPFLIESALRWILVSAFLIIIPFDYCRAQEDAEDEETEDNCYKPDSEKLLKQFDAAVLEYKRKNFIEANTMLKEIIEKDPLFPDPYYVLALINVERRDYNVNAAETYFLKTIELCPYYDMEAYYYLGSIYYGSEKWDLAVKYLKIFLKDVSLIDDDTKLSDAQLLFQYAEFNNRMYNSPVPFDPYIVKEISSPADEYLAIISPDEELALYTRRQKMPPNKNDLIPQEKEVEVFSYSENIDGKWTKGQAMEYPFNQFDNEGGATLSVNNKELFYTVAKNEGGYKNADIHYCKKDADGFWSEPENMSAHINLPYSWDSQPSLSSDGKTLYFCSDRAGGYGGYDIWYTQKSEDGSWSEARNLGPRVNSRGNEKSPFIHPDGQTLYLASDGWTGVGGYDIFLIRLPDEKSWKQPRNLGYPINTSDDETSFFVSTNGKTGYFASNILSESGGWDLFAFDLYEEARPGEVLFIKGTLKDESNELPVMDAFVQLKNVFTKKIIDIPVDPRTGEYVAITNFDNDFILTVKKQGFAYESRYIAKEDSSYMKPAELDLGIKEIEVGQTYKLNDINFATNSYALNDASRMIIDGFIEFLNENPGVKVAIHGHTDNVGGDDANLLLSENRARSVYEHLILNNIDAGRLTYQGFGETQPLVSNDTAAGRAQNRRTVFVIVSR